LYRLVTLICTRYPNEVGHLYWGRYPVQMPHICTGWSRTPIQMCFTTVSLFPFPFLYFFSFSHFILISSTPLQSNPIQIQSNKIYTNSHPTFTPIFISNHKIHNKSSITISMHLTIIHHIPYKFNLIHLTISQHHRRNKKITHKCI
jgi:hypothetical protein